MVVSETSLSAFGAITREAGDFQLAERSLLSAVRSAKAQKAYQVLCGACFHLARLYFHSGDRGKGRRYLKQAMELASRIKYYMFWDIHIPTLTEMALLSIRHSYHAGFAAELLSRFYDPATVNYLAEKQKPSTKAGLRYLSKTLYPTTKPIRGKGFISSKRTFSANRKLPSTASKSRIPNGRPKKSKTCSNTSSCTAEGRYPKISCWISSGPSRIPNRPWFPCARLCTSSESL